MIYHAIDYLLHNSGIKKDKIFYINIENPLYLGKGLEELFAMARKAVGTDSSDGCFVFFDEIQYLKDWEIHLKVLVDAYQRTKFIASGSAAAELKLKSAESGAGRFTDFILPPLTFYEYIYMCDFDILIKEKEIVWKNAPQKFISTNNIQELNKHFIKYINLGGVP